MWKRLPINYSWFLPDGCRTARQLTLERKFPQAVAELERLAALGSRDARAALGYLYLRGTPVTPVNLTRARELVEPAARAGHPYAEYVMGWISLLSEKDAVRTIRWWSAAAEKEFSPAALEIARFLATDLPGKPPLIPRAIKALGRARALGHMATSMMRARLVATGGVGIVPAVIARLALPLHMAVFALRVRQDPFAENVFIHHPSASMELFELPRVDATAPLD